MTILDREPTRPLRSEVLGADGLEALAAELAAGHRLAPARRGNPLLQRLSANHAALRLARADLSTAVRAGRAITPAAEWLLDNFFLVEVQALEIREALPRGYYRELPRLADGRPRVYSLAEAFVAHTDSSVDPVLLERFVRGYQSVEALTLGELWAVAINLRLVLVENLRRLADLIAERLRDRGAAAEVFDRAITGDAPAASTIATAIARRNSPAFVVELLQRLREPDPSVEPLARAVDDALAAAGVAAEALIRQEHQTQASNQVTVANIIASFRQLSAIDWPKFVEGSARVEALLRSEPSGIHAAQDFATRDAARHAIEQLSRGSSSSESAVAERALALAAAAPGHPVAYFLLGDGRLALERELGFRARWSLRLERAVRRLGLGGYAAATAILTVALLALLLALAAVVAHPPASYLALIGVLALLPAWEGALAIQQRLLTLLMPARSLPKLALTDGIPAALRTLVAVPMMLSDEEEVRALVERLEVHYLANDDGDLYFALLADFTDASTATTPADDALLATARHGIEELNRKHGAAPGGGDRFRLLWRERRRNDVAGLYMGWERKRGKLHELNRLLRGATDTSYVAVEAPRDVHYVVTLDADTRVPRGAVRRLVGTIAHPLHWPRLAEPGSPLEGGYAIVQPRTLPILPPRGEESIYQWLFAGPTGLDPYVGAVSDLYQDLFGEGSYTGKGIYDVDAFEHALHDRVPENTLLSHDLFEGSFARVALATDIVLFEEFPTHAGVDASRQHRWTRGDWQLLPWLAPSVPTRAGRTPNPLAPLALWKLADNLRRSLTAPAALALMLATWWLSPVAELLAWQVAAAAWLALPAALASLRGLLPRRAGVAKRTHLGAVLRETVTMLAQAGLGVVFLADRALLRLDAIVRTLSRLRSRRHLLEWTTAARARSAASARLASFYRRSLPALLATGVAVAGLALTRPTALPGALPLAIAFALAPAIARWLSSPLPERSEPPLVAAETAALRGIARRTWEYFDRFAGAEENFLPADNVQEDPRLEVAHRTSPTNLGLGLLATLAARDLGWLGALDTADRIARALDALDSLERYRGHFLNWYDTRTMQPLQPRYVSTVDSGNLAGHLLVVAAALREPGAAEPDAKAARSGTTDALRLLAEIAGREREAALTKRSLALARHLEGPPAAGWLAAALAEAKALQASAQELVGRASSGPEAVRWAAAAIAALSSHARDVEALGQLAERRLLARRLESLAARAEQVFDGMDFSFLLDPERRLFAVGFRLNEERLDNSFYDLLASECRLASFLAVGKGDVPASHWFRLGRPVTPIGRGSALLSWSGSMFEYLMPALVLAEPAGSVLDDSEHLAVSEHRHYAREHAVPWGISESAYNARDVQLLYQYGPFGVPALGMKRSPIEELVVAPYATGLAAMVVPRAALDNFAALARLGALGPYGFYESIDFTPSRLPEGATHVVVRTTMGHHQAMTLVALANVVCDNRMRVRFHRQAVVRAAELLLQERTPRDVLVARHLPEERLQPRVQDDVLSALRRFETPHTTVPRAHALSNGNFTTVITNAGGGFCRRGEIAITRWRPDSTTDAWGTFLYLRDSASAKVWSAAFQPSGVEADEYAALYSESRVEIARRDGAISSVLEIIVSREHDAELRRLTLVNHSTRPREIEVTSYAELSLARPAEDSAHPAFAKLFVETEWARSPGALLAHRRTRSPGERAPWVAHVLAYDGPSPAPAPQFETDRARFLGRDRGVASPLAVADGRPLSGTTGAVLDPIFSLRARVTLLPGASVRLIFTTLMADDREEALRQAGHFAEAAAWDRAATLAWTHSQVELRHVGMTVDEAHLFQRLASRALYPDPALRASAALVERNRLGRSALWAHGISGDLPIVLLRVDAMDQREVARQLLRALSYWRLRGLAIDVVVLNEHPEGYAPHLQQEMEILAANMGLTLGASSQGGLFVLRGDRIAAEARDLLRVAACVELRGYRGTITEQLLRVSQLTGAVPATPPTARTLPRRAAPPPSSEGLELWNGLGGFADGGRSYDIHLDHGTRTPAPWINVIANERFGFQVSAAGSGFTWSENSHERRLTPWSNDAVSDPPGEALYVRDDESGEIGSPTLLPLGDDGAPYVCRHGRGWSAFTHEWRGLRMTLLQLAAPQAAVKLSRLRLENRTGRPRTLTVAAYCEWVLAEERSTVAPWTVTELDLATGTILARNRWREEFADRVAFAALPGADAATGDRAEFLGRNGSTARPAGLRPGHRFSGTSGALLDPCAALSRKLTLAPGASVDVPFLIGDADDDDAARALVEEFRAADLVALQREVEQGWDDVTGALQVETPERSFDVMVNHWLLYQAIACRLWARSAFYQSSGAYGFRDQLQDSMAAAVAAPATARAQIVRAAARQFLEGDVQHWWHEPSGRGVRTHCSDDLLWLPFAAAHYVAVTGDAALLDEEAAFLEQPALAPQADDDYRQPDVAVARGTIREHCVRAVELALQRRSPRGLPLFGSGDWNDGMNRVGAAGTGESVWLGWFLCSVLETFTPLVEHAEPARAERWLEELGVLAAALESAAWDGHWYLRGTFDDGTPLGGQGAEACSIDSIAQSWAVLSHAADPERARQAMAAVEQHLVRRGDGLVLLFAPPFREGEDTPAGQDPGYIRGYPPGIRENGGQYTHAALWTVLAFAELGEGERAYELFSMLNPIHHSSTLAGMHRYRVEPYVAAADVYSEPPHVGRGGWTWYTGSAGWMYRAATEWILGFRLRGATLQFAPCIPRAWPGYRMRFRYHGATYLISVENPRGSSRDIAHVELDGVALDTASIPLVADGATHHVRVVLGTRG